MISTSQAWKDYTRDIGVFHIKATMTGGSTLNITDSDFMMGSVSFTDSMSGMSEIALGAVVTNTFNATLNNFNGRFDNWDWNEIEVWFGIEVNGTEEWIHRGIYTIDRPNSLGNTIKIECYDYMDKLNKYFAGLSATLTYPVDSNDMAEAICTYCGVDYGYSDLSTFNVAEFEIDESTTCRQVLMWVLQTDGLYARINPVTGELDCKKWNVLHWSASDTIEGGIFDVWNAVANTNGGTLSPWSVVTDYNGGTFFDGDGAYSLERVKRQTIMIEDVEVTGIRAYAYNTVDEFAFDTAGSDGYIIALQDNPLITEDNVSTVASRAWANVDGLKVRPFDSSIFGDPSIEAGDTIILKDYKGNYYVSVITNMTFNLGGDTRVSCDAETPVEKVRETANPVTSAIKGATMAAYDYITARKISADYITAGTIEAAVIAKNFTMDGGKINVHTQGKDDNVIELDWQSNVLERKLKLTPNCVLLKGNTDMTSLSWDDSTSFLAGEFTIHRDRSDNTSRELKYQGDGQLVMSRNGTVNVMLDATGTCTSRAWNLYSLEEYKKSIKKVDSALEKIKNADVVEYHYNDEDDDSKKHIGLAVGEHFNVPQEVIATDEDGNEVGVDIYAMVSMAWKAIQEQNEKIEALEKRVAELEVLNEKKEK